jgi:paired amphipathic helix protein Sin3a
MQSLRLKIIQGEVSKQIALLFEDAPDLRHDFRIFMPENSQQIFNGDSVFPAPPLDGRNRTGTPVIDGKPKRKLEAGGLPSGTSGVGTSSPLPQKRKRKPVDKEKEREKDIVITASKVGPSSKVSAVSLCLRHVTPNSHFHC